MTAPMIMTNCPTDPELLAAFIDGRLQGNERRTVVEHMTTCADCRDVFLMASEMAEETGQSGTVVPIRQSWVGPAVTLAAAAAIAAVVFLGPVRDRVFGPWRLRQLRAATAELQTRPLEARPSIDMVWKSFPRPRGPGDTTVHSSHAAADILDAAGKRPTVANLHAAGIAWLLMNEPTLAVQVLENALKKQTARTDVLEAIAASTDADLLNDLAAAYHDVPDDKNALVAIERAWQLNPKSLPVAWTRATIVDTAAAWDDYLALDNTSAWAEEARTMRENYTLN